MVKLRSLIHDMVKHYEPWEIGNCNKYSTWKCVQRNGIYQPLLIFKAASHCPEINPRWTHENEALHDLLRIFWHAEDLPSDHELEVGASEIELVVITRA